MRKLLVIIGLGGLVWLGGFLMFITTIPQAPKDVPDEADAAVILTGGSERLKEGISLLVNGKVRTVFISGVGQGASKGDLLGQTGYKAEEVFSLMPYIFLGFEASDTQSNAAEVAQWVTHRGIRSFYLVTSNYHMWRSLNELKAQLPAQEIYPYPVVPEHVKVGDWWQHPNSTKLLFSEYHKFVISYFRTLVAVQ